MEMQQILLILVSLSNWYILVHNPMAGFEYEDDIIKEFQLNLMHKYIIYF